MCAEIDSSITRFNFFSKETMFCFSVLSVLRVDFGNNSNVVKIATTDKLMITALAGDNSNFRSNFKAGAKSSFITHFRCNYNCAWEF